MCALCVWGGVGRLQGFREAGLKAMVISGAGGGGGHPPVLLLLPGPVLLLPAIALFQAYRVATAMACTVPLLLLLPLAPATLLPYRHDSYLLACLPCMWCRASCVPPCLIPTGMPALYVVPCLMHTAMTHTYWHACLVCGSVLRAYRHYSYLLPQAPAVLLACSAMTHTYCLAQCSTMTNIYCLGSYVLPHRCLRPFCRAAMIHTCCGRCWAVTTYLSASCCCQQQGSDYACIHPWGPCCPLHL